MVEFKTRRFDFDASVGFGFEFNKHDKYFFVFAKQDDIDSIEIGLSKLLENIKNKKPGIIATQKANYIHSVL